VLIDERFYSVGLPQTLHDLLYGLSVSLPDAKFDDELISRPALLEDSQPGDICFLADKKHAGALDAAKATACLVEQELAGLVGEKHIIPIVSDTPKAHFSRITQKLVRPKTLESEKGHAMVDASASVHATAVIGAGAVIKARAVIGPFCSIGPGVEIGEQTRIEPNVQLQCCVIGTNCHIKSGAVIGGRGFGVSMDENGLVDVVHTGRVIIGNSVTIGSASCVDRGQLSDTVLEDNVKLDNLVQIGHNVRIGQGTLIAAQTGISGSTNIGRGVIMGGGVGIADHLKIGDGVTIAARAGVMHNIPAGEKWSGVPAMPIRDHMKTIVALKQLSKGRQAKDGNDA